MAEGGSGERAAPGVLLGGRYRLERSIGAGGMASVWLGKDEELGRPVAVKMISEALAHDRQFLARFSREARTAASLNHPNLVNIFDLDPTGERPYLVMEYVEGETLDEVIATSTGRLDPARVARELLSALRHIHAEGIVHRDVKPQNILVGEDDRIRLTDFGIARPEDATSLTTTGQVLGTLRYLAPEVRLGEAATVRSDLFSAGIVIGECLGQGASGALTELAARMSDAEPQARPSSAAAALSELDDTGRLGVRAPEPTEVLPAAAERTEVLAAEPEPGTASDDAVPTEEGQGEQSPPFPSEGQMAQAPPSPRTRVRGRHVIIAAIVLVAAIIAAAVALDDDRGKPPLKPRGVERAIEPAGESEPLIEPVTEPEPLPQQPE